MPNPIPEQLREALDRFNARDLAGTEQLCGEILRRAPGNPDALHLLGLARLAAGNVQEALDLIGKARQGSPRDAAILENLGVAHLAAREYVEAEKLLRRALRLRPTHGLLHMRLGLALAPQGKLEQAVAALEKAAYLAPGDPDVHLNLGNALVELGETDKALARYRNVLALQPQHAAAHFNIGTLCRKAGRLDEARVALHDALAAAPDDPDVHVNLATVYEDQGRLEDAVSHNRGALKLDPHHVHALKNLANVLGMQGKLDEAIANYERVLDLKPDHYQALSELAYQRQRACSWDGIELLWERLRREAIGVDPEVSFAILSFTASPQEQLACATARALRNFAPYARVRSRLAFDFSARLPRARLRIGYLSWDFRQHPLSYLIAELFELHDRGRFEITAYSLGPDDGSAIRGRIKSGCDRFVDVSREPDIDVARRIYADGIDILVDLQGYTTGSRSPIIALRPAPVQVNWLGHPGTMGTDCIDYIIADPFIIPEGMEHHYSEKVVRLPDCYQINDRKREISDRTPSRAECGLPAGAFVFCCFNQPYKILPDTFALWMRILKAVPDSGLWLAEANRWQPDNLRREAAVRGIAGDRLVFATRKPLAEYLAQYRVADLALDTFPYTSHTTASDALWMGCPLVTRTGKTFASRVAGSILINAGMRELVTDNPDDYERKVLDLAASPGKLQETRRRLHAARDSCPLFDTPRFVRNLESAYEAMFGAYLNGKA